MGTERQQTQGTTYGNAWMHRALIGMLRHIDVRVFYAFLAVFVVPVTLMVSPGARLTYRYYHRQRGYGRWRAVWATYRNHCVFGQTVVDKFAMYAGKQFVVNFNGQDVYDAMTRRPEALLQLSAHIGCSEILGYSYNNHKPCNVLVYGGEKAELMNYRQSAFGHRHVKMIPVGIDGSHSEDIIAALDKGEIVSAFADRFMNANKLVVSTIYGHRVRLARGPFSLAVTRGLDVVMASAMKERDGSYTAFFTPLTYDKTLSARQQRQQLADAYCAEVERLLDRYPEQWFNYSDPWTENEI